MRIDPTGRVTACPYMDTQVGDLRLEKLANIWNESPDFKRLRTVEYDGKCGLCRYRMLCGGCRARALATLGNDMGEDQWCVYEPVGQEEAIENIDTTAKFGAGKVTSNVQWNPEATQKLESIPVFAREMVRLGVEQYAVDHKIKTITLEVMGKSAPQKPPMFGQPTSEVQKTKDITNIQWDDDALARVENAPDFVRAGILKLMAKRARERGVEKIDTKFLSEIRDESMMLVTRRMKRLGARELDMDVWGKVQKKMSGDEKKSEVISQIQSFLGERSEINHDIIKKFGSFFSDTTGEKMGWTEDARERLSRAPSLMQNMVKKTIEKHARTKGYKFVTLQAMEEVMDGMPFKQMMGKSNKTVDE